MPCNQGKIFEQQLRKSTPAYALLYRLPDPAQSFGGSSKLRFSAKNPFDFLLWDSRKHILYALELKTVAGKSISFERSKGESGEIHFYQIDGLKKWNEYDGIVCGFIIEFRELSKTVFIEIEEFNRLLNVVSKKSFNYDDLEKNDISFTVISQTKARTRYTYDIDGFLTSMK